MTVTYKDQSTKASIPDYPDDNLTDLGGKDGKAGSRCAALAAGWLGD